MNLLNELKAIQEHYGYLPEGELRALAQRTTLPLHRIQAVASFYPHFRLRPAPQRAVKMCADLPCHLAGAPRLLRVARRYGHTECEIGTTSCLGRC
ncbi:MAG: NAD(P)H-dependent oxidoreductase subunit E, partial [Candidatus Binatia bacterium]|nr:NAD(P)H-dependent oxidoreductase subunit E [Candidatus Binatia bacterium]